MKKIALSIIIATMTLSLVGCDSKSSSKLDKVTKELENSYVKINELTEQVNKLSEELQQQTNEVYDKIYDFDNLELGSYDKNDGIVEIRVSYLQDDYQKSYEAYIRKLESQGKTVIAPKEIKGQALFTIQTNEILKNVTYYENCDDFMDACGMDIEKSIMKHGLSNNGNLAKELKPGEILVFALHESEGIPTGYFYWTEESGKVVYNTVSFDGSGKHYIYD